MPESKPLPFDTDNIFVDDPERKLYTFLSQRYIVSFDVKIWEMERIIDLEEINPELKGIITSIAYYPYSNLFFLGCNEDYRIYFFDIDTLELRKHEAEKWYEELIFCDSGKRILNKILSIWKFHV